MGALGDQLFVIPSVKDGENWIGKIVDRGFKVLKFSTYNICDKVIYNKNDVIRSDIFENKAVHVISFKNIKKIEGIY
jgi:hypothetical protein